MGALYNKINGMFGMCWSVLFKPKEEDQSDCPICLDPLGTSWKQTKCGHRFHTKCILAWDRYRLRHRKTKNCPLCRKFVDPPLVKKNLQ